MVTSVYFGGGTPSLAPPSAVKSILDVIQQEVGLVDDCEVTLELNPTLDVLDNLLLFKEAGVTRVSIGVQSLDNNTLKNVLYRNHTSSDAKHVIAEACGLFHNAVNVDMMFGLPDQSVGVWLNHLSHMIRSHPFNHLSLYQLTLERGTEMFKNVQKGKWILPPEDVGYECYQKAIELLAECGFVQYEVSNFARNGFQSVHNLNYWLGGNYIGIGPGAHSCYQDRSHSSEYTKTVNILTPKQWMIEVERNEGIAIKKYINHWERFEEVFCTSLRTNIGLTKEMCCVFGVVFEELVYTLQTELPDNFAKFIVADEAAVKVSPEGLMVLDSVLTHILIVLENVRTSYV